MDWLKLFLSDQGRINRRDFWVGFVLLLVASLVMGMIPLLGWGVVLLLIWPQICIHSKRLHDMGRSAWLQLIPLGVTAVFAGVAVVLAVAALLGVLPVGSSSGGGPGSEPGDASMPDMGGAAALVGIALLCGLCLLLCGLCFLLWVGLSKGEPGPNRYGPPPGSRTDFPAG